MNQAAAQRLSIQAPGGKSGLRRAWCRVTPGTFSRIYFWRWTDSAAENIPPDHLTTKTYKKNYYCTLLIRFSGQVVR